MIEGDTYVAVSLLAASVVVVGSLVLARWLVLQVAANNKAAAARRAAKEAEAQAAAEALAERLGELLEVFQANPDATLNELLSLVPDTDQYYRPKKGEEILYVAPARMAQMTTTTRAITYGGLAVSMKIWGPVRYRSGTTTIHRVPQTALQLKGEGMLVVTNKRLLFNALDRSSKDWSRTWATVSTWGVFADAVQVELTNGKPIVFLLDANIPMTHPGFVSAVMEFAHG